MTSSESKATYDEIKTYVKEHTGLLVSSLYIAQVKQKCGIIERENYNKAKSDDAKQPNCPKDKLNHIKESCIKIGEIVMLRSVEAVIALSGGAGTLAEIANAYHLCIPIFTLRDCGGWSEKLSGEYIDKKEKTQVVEVESCEELVKKIISKCKFNRKLVGISSMIEKGKMCEEK